MLRAVWVSLVCSTVSLALPPNTRSWECIPSVILDNGADFFMLKVTVNGPVTKVTLRTLSSRLVGPGRAPLDLRDEGDGVFTVGPFAYEKRFPIAERTFWFDPSSPAGLDDVYVGELIVTEVTGEESRFLLNPTVGVLSATIPLVSPCNLAPGVAATKHLVNVQTSEMVAQEFLRQTDDKLPEITKPLLSVVPDTIDQIIVLSTAKLERVPFNSRENFNSGEHRTVKVDWTGSGRPARDCCAAYGSQGGLYAVNAIDVGQRGLYTGNVLHEVSHLWSAYTDQSLGLTDPTGHWCGRTSIGSILGGFQWTPAESGYTVNTTQGLNGGTHAAPLDLYMMGLIDADQVPAIMRYDQALPAPLHLRGNPVTPVATVSILDIQAIHGLRTPGPAEARKQFRLAFVAESTGRLLNQVEMSYLETLAEWFGKPIPDGAPDPRCAFNWVPITRYFGQGTVWTTQVPRFFDFDVDGDVELDDMAQFQACHTGPAIPIRDRWACAYADADRDGDVDQTDFGLFQQCIGSRSPYSQWLVRLLFD